MTSPTTRRKFIQGAGVVAAGFVGGRTQAAAGQPQHGPHDHDPAHAPSDEPAAEHPPQDDYPRFHPGPSGPVGADIDRGKRVAGFRRADESPVPVETPNLPKLPWKMAGGVKEFHLVAEPVRREFLPGMWFDVWGYNGSMPGPMIEAVEGDRVRIVVHNELPEPTTVHWHGFELPVRMDGVPGVTQDPIMPGEEFVYEFDLHQNGTFFYHSHGAMQEIMGQTGFFIVHPRRPHSPPVDHDFGIILQEFAILHQNTIPDSISEEFNFFTFNGRAGPYTKPMLTQLGSRVRLRFLNLSAMDAHPIHLHGHTFWITGTEAGRIPDTAWIPSNNVLVGVGQTRDVEFIANNPGDWMLHCHILHHMMNHMVAMVGPMMDHGPEVEHHGDAAPAPTGSVRNAQPERDGGRVSRLLPTLKRLLPDDLPAIPREKDPRYEVPGYPQDMMGMPPAHDPADLHRPETRGLRRNWFQGVHGMMTLVRVLPEELYQRVLDDDATIPPGASTPGAGPGEMPDHEHHPHEHEHDHPSEPKPERDHEH